LFGMCFGCKPRLGGLVCPPLGGVHDVSLGYISTKRHDHGVFELNKFMNWVFFGNLKACDYQKRLKVPGKGIEQPQGGQVVISVYEIGKLVCEVD
jgi:hypothetical protein